MLIIMFWLS